MAQPVVEGPLARLAGTAEVVDDVPAAFARLAAAAVNQRSPGGFALCCSGGASGRACLEALLARPGLDLSVIEWFFADERCVPPGDPASNAGMLEALLAHHDGRHGPLHRLSCAEGPAPYQTLLERRPPLDLVQLGFGPDGHTASLFPGSSALDAPESVLVATNSDPSGRNPHERLTLTFAGIARARRVVVTVVGVEKADALARICAGEDLPARRLRAPDLHWLLDAAAVAAMT